ncbi:mandelate racemase/muconate lactonizing enzyme family protein [Candidatus Poribacteria bacterium]|nr:mandelate racemase/muconate lactonizing enzyme family protein [Candidatus Poribacteria bacterium]MXV83960.1 mandelate racemase/muconate lactonizing enzyme family protein [Candidatus Poribacteria bacterium]MYA56302.1 mandelate racemase/muconate lactonizing enzyme family protein [Candidatus Poribacteria bacterium]
MKIDKVESFFIRNGYVIRIHTDTGLSGVGQTACWGYPEAVDSIINTFKKHLIGQNPLRIEHHWQYLYRMGPFRGTALSGAISAVDIALWDIKGKHFGVPIWELLGGNCRDKIRLHLLGGGSTPETMYDAAKAAVEEGFTALKFDPVVGGFQDMTVDRLVKTARDIVAAAREGGGPDLDLIVEVHRKLTPMNSIVLESALAPFNLYFIEDPIQIDTITTQAELAKRMTTPLAIGERNVSIWEFRELLEAGGPQYVRPDLGLAGGITHCKKIAALAEAYHSAVVTHNFLGPLITAASLHLDTSIPNFITQEYTKGDESEDFAVYKVAYQREGGYIPIPEAPGLGIELDDSLIEENPYQPMNTGTTPLREDGSVAYAV